MISAKSIFWALPYNSRQQLYKLFKRKKFNRYHEKNSGVNSQGFSFHKFHQYKCIYIHIPKCGGIALANTLFGNLGPGHVPVKSFQLVLTKEQFDSYFKFTIVRNPWDRAVSAFLFLKKGGFNERDRLWAEKHFKNINTFDEFVKKWLVKKGSLQELHFKPQYEYICDTRGNLMVDYIGRFEDYKNSYDYILSRVGLNPGEMKKENVTEGRRDYKAYYTPETMAIVGELYKKDIELLGYSF